VFGQLCPLEFGAKAGNPRGIIDLDAPTPYCSEANGSGAIEDLIEFGSGGTCAVNETGGCAPQKNGPWYDCVAVQTGNPKKVLDGFNARIQREGSCDDDSSGVEEFDEVLELVFDGPTPATDVYAARVCPNGEISPRIITIIVLESPPPPGNDGHPIVGFASFYVEGCAWDKDAPPSPVDLDPECPNKPGGGPPGHATIFGRFATLTVAGGEVGEFDPSNTLRGISLVE
jgi:hypothetical protein